LWPRRNRRGISAGQGEVEKEYQARKEKFADDEKKEADEETFRSENFDVFKIS